MLSVRGGRSIVPCNRMEPIFVWWVGHDLAIDSQLSDPVADVPGCAHRQDRGARVRQIVSATIVKAELLAYPRSAAGRGEGLSVERRASNPRRCR